MKVCLKQKFKNDKNIIFICHAKKWTLLSLHWQRAVSYGILCSIDNLCHVCSFIWLSFGMRNYWSRCGVALVSLYLDGPHSNPSVHLDLFWIFLNFNFTNQISCFERNCGAASLGEWIKNLVVSNALIKVELPLWI